jgi:hypothetical protein
VAIHLGLAMADCSVMLLTVLRRQQYGTPVDYYLERMSKVRFIVLKFYSPGNGIVKDRKRNKHLQMKKCNERQ